jgi:hypothetical protein
LKQMLKWSEVWGQSARSHTLRMVRLGHWPFLQPSDKKLPSRGAKEILVEI